MLGIIVVIILCAALVYVFKNKNSGNNKKPVVTTEAETTSSAHGDEVIKGDYFINISAFPGMEKVGNIKIKGLDEQKILEKVKKNYEWNMTIVNPGAEVGAVVKPTVGADVSVESGDGGDNAVLESQETTAEEETSGNEIVVAETIPVDDFIEYKVLKALDQIFDDNANGKEGSVIYALTMDGLDAFAKEAAQKADDMWYKEPKGGNIGSYDAENDEFLIENEEDGYRIDKDGLKEDIVAAISAGEYQSELKVTTEILPGSDVTTAGSYKIIGEYVTKTTDNRVRNNNIRLACETLNGTIVRSGEEFSFNDAIGKRTAEKGYGAAAAYLNGEVILEIGGGVCQLSSTLYNAVVTAGLKTTSRYSHTFKPSYVTPGQDATISWGGPDYRFANVPGYEDYCVDTSYAIGIRAKYEDRTVTVTIYGRPVLKDGYELSLESEKIATYPVVRKPIPEDDLERQPTTGDEGSSWKTYLIVKKDGEVVSRSVDHGASYSGHTEWYREEEETSETESESESESETMPLGPGGIVPTTESTQSPGPAEIESPVQPTTQSQPTVPEVSPGPGGTGGSGGTGGPGSSGGSGTVTPGGPGSGGSEGSGGPGGGPGSSTQISDSPLGPAG